MSKKRLITASIVAASFSLVLAGCGQMSDTPVSDPDASTDGAMQPETPETDSESSDAAAPESSESGELQEGCFVHLYDSDNFDENDSNFRLTVPGEYADLANLPGADQDWTDDADSLKVGPKATVTVWSEKNFEGTKLTFQHGTDQPDLDDEPQSLKLSCGI